MATKPTIINNLKPTKATTLPKLKPKNDWAPWHPWDRLATSQKAAFAILITMLFALPIGLSITTQTKAPFRGEAGQAKPSERENAIPSISTSELPDGKINQNYKNTIIGYDMDLANNLTMTVAGLPSGILLNSCKESTMKLSGSGKTVRQIKCLISGTPTVSGVSQVEITLTDGVESITKTLPLAITR